MLSRISRISPKLKGVSNHAIRSFGGQSQIDRSQNRVIDHSPTKMTASEAFVETLIAQGVTDVFGIVGSAFMDALDLFDDAGIRFISTQHEQGAVHMADGYARMGFGQDSSHAKHGVCVAQNGPGITNFVTGLGAAYWAHSPVVAITPESGTMTDGLGGFQEVPNGSQLDVMSAVTKFQAHINNPARMAELTGRAFDVAMHERGPTQINIPRDFFYSTHTYSIPRRMNLKHGMPSAESMQEALDLISKAKNPVILAGGGVLMADGGSQKGIDELKKLAEYLNIPVATTYLHNDSMDMSHSLSVGSLGYQGSKAAMNCIHSADLILAIGTRMSPFGSLPQYDFDYFPKNAKIIQCEIDSRRLGLTRPCDVYLHGDSGQVLAAIRNGLESSKRDILCKQDSLQSDRLNSIKNHKESWEKELNDWTHSMPHLNRDGKIRPRAALRALERAMPDNSVVSSDIGNICSVSNSYLRFSNSLPSMLAAMTFGNCQYALGSAMGAKVANPDRPVIAYAGDGAAGMGINEMLTCSRESIPVTSVIFRNDQWGAEKKNQVLWFGDRYTGVNLKNDGISFSDMAKAMGCESIRVDHEDQVGDALKRAMDLQLIDRKASVIEIMCTRELGDPFRRDAMKLPQRLLSKYTGTNEHSESPTGQPVDM